MKERHTLSTKKKILALVLMAPAAVLIGVFFVWPMIMTVYYAFTNLTLTGAQALDTQFTGLQNFKNVFSDPKFKTVMMNTIVFLIFSGIIGQQVFGFIFASLMKKRNVYVRRFTGFAVVLGWITPEIIAAYMFGAFFNDKGTLNMIIRAFGGDKVSWLFTYPMLSVIIANIWKGTAYSMLMFQAALDSISDDIVEAAKIDGAGPWKVLTRITLPMIKGTTAITFIMVTLGTLGTFGMIYAFTGGGPGIKTTTLSVYMYQQAFGTFQVGYGMAIALFLLAIGIVMSLIYMKVIKANKE